MFIELKNQFIFLPFFSSKVGTKSVKQCIEFHYMPKVNLTSRKIYPKATSSVMTRRKRVQMIKAQQQLEDETSSSSFNELRLVSDSIDSASSNFLTSRMMMVRIVHMLPNSSVILMSVHK